MRKTIADPNAPSLGIAVFVKTPKVSSLKTRLAADLGEEKTLQFYELCIQCLEQQLLSLQSKRPLEIAVYWSVAEEDQLDHPLWKNLARFWQGEGGLGDRLHRSQEIMRSTHSKLAFLGADLPIIDTQVFSDFFDQAKIFGEKQICQFGPTEDGGFYTYMSNSSLDKDIWLRPEYSKDTTLSELKTAINRTQVETLPDLETTFDVDFIDDLTKLKNHPRLDEDTFLELRSFLHKNL